MRLLKSAMPHSTDMSRPACHLPVIRFVAATEASADDETSSGSEPCCLFAGSFHRSWLR